MPTPLDLGVAIELENTVYCAAAALSDRIAGRLETESRIDEDHIAHMTLFQGRFPRESEGHLPCLFSRFAHRVGTREVRLVGSLTVSKAGDVFWEARLSPELLSIHLKAFYSFRPLTGGLLLPQFRDLRQDRRHDSGRIERFGMASAGEKFVPHITLCRLSKPREDEVFVRRVKAPESSFLTRYLLLGRLGIAGNVKRILSRESTE